MILAPEPEPPPQLVVTSVAKQAMTREIRLMKRFRRELDGNSPNTSPARMTAAPPAGRLED